MPDLVPYESHDPEPIVVEGELVDDTCYCGAPGRLVVDPYLYELYDEIEMVVLCDDCHQERRDDI